MKHHLESLGGTSLKKLGRRLIVLGKDSIIRSELGNPDEPLEIKLEMVMGL